MVKNKGNRTCVLPHQESFCVKNLEISLARKKVVYKISSELNIMSTEKIQEHYLLNKKIDKVESISEYLNKK